MLISSDKTQLTLFRGKTAYPVYLTIGNLPKEIRRKPSRQAHILLGYLPTTRLKHITSPTSRRRALANLFHAGVRMMLEPLITAGQNGIPMQSGDGILRRCHPLFAAFVGDYPEQLLVTCSKVCPTCDIPREALGSGELGNPKDFATILEAFELADGPPREFLRACREIGVKPVYHPFWEGFPYLDIFRAITPDILHQLYQGLIKHLVAWLTNPKVFGAKEVDARCRRMPPNHNARLFTKGITTLSRVSGQEHRDMSRILMGLIVDLRLPNGHSPVRLLRAVRGMLDFLYLAQYKVHTSQTLEQMQASLDLFHANKSIFVDLDVRAHFQLPKLHNAGHYQQMVQLYGTTDNYNTQTTERLHIDLAKDAFQASNMRDEFAQMTLWLERKEKVLRHQDFVKWRLRVNFDHESPAIERHSILQHPHIVMTKFPTVYSVDFDTLANNYGAYDIHNALALYVAREKDPSISGARLARAAANIILPFYHLRLFHKIRFYNRPLERWLDSEDFMDVAHARPQYKDKQGRVVAGRFDTVLVQTDPRDQDADGDQIAISRKFRVNETR